jgi:hypothetical protein
MKKSLFIFLLLPFCLFAQKKGAAIKVVDATFQQWVSGAPGGKSGTKYSIKVRVMTQEPVEFKNLWLGEENVLFNVEYYKQPAPAKLHAGDSVLLTYNKVVGEKPDSTEKKRIPIRIEYKWAALIECLVHGKAKYFIIKHFDELEPLKGR